MTTSGMDAIRKFLEKVELTPKQAEEVLGKALKKTGMGDLGYCVFVFDQYDKGVLPYMGETSKDQRHKAVCAFAREDSELTKRLRLYEPPPSPTLP